MVHTKKKFIVHSIVAIAIFICFSALESCSSSESSTQQEEEIAPEQNSIHQDSVKQEVKPVPPLQQPGKPVVKPKISQGFVTQEDTIEIQSGKKRISSNITKTPSQRIQPKKKYFTIQIGAFKMSENAERAKMFLRKRFNVPTSQFFDTSIKMNRVFGGIFATRKGAFNFLAKIKNEFPAEYSHAWVAERMQ